jgi:hypothetical protein
MAIRYSKRHYIDCARILRDHREKNPGDNIDHLERLFGDMFARDNSRFSWERFTTACRPPEREGSNA